jgi:glycosyltransferase involved in cell wall biosynthesis
MKIVNVHPGILPIPPKNWGAVEKIIWNYTLELKNLGIDASFKYLDEIDPNQYDIIHCHVTNLANMAHERGMEYFLSMHDHHILFEYPDDRYLAETRHAIKNSIKTFVHTEEFFTHKNFSDLSDKFIYIRHGVDRNIYTNKQLPREDLLCIASNGFIGFPNFDRKGFLMAVQVANYLNMNLTICCPSNTKEFLSTHNLMSSDNITIKCDLSEEELINQYNTHKVFLHPSVLEAGHPNLTLVEALACGIPVVGSYKGSLTLPGMFVVNDYSPISYTNAIRTVLQNYDQYSEETENIDNFEWENIVLDLLGLYKKYGYTLNKFKSVLYNSYSKTLNTNVRQILPANKINATMNKNGDIKIEINGPEEAQYVVKFVGTTEDGIEIPQYQTEIKNNMWCTSANNGFIQWSIYINNELHNTFKIERSK